MVKCYEGAHEVKTEKLLTVFGNEEILGEFYEIVFCWVVMTKDWLAWILETVLERTGRPEADTGNLDYIFEEIFYKMNGETEQSYKEEYGVKGVALCSF